MASKPLPTVTEWCKKYITAIFEATNEADTRRAAEIAFSPDIKCLLNGRHLDHEGMTQLILNMQRTSATGLKLDWQEPLVDFPLDPNNRDGHFGGVYIVRGVRREVPGKGLLDYARYKTVNVRIESQSDDPSVDNRKMVSIVCTAADIRI